MKMELFLNHINQEMIDKGTSRKVSRDIRRDFPGAPRRADWSVWGSWTVSCCVLDFSMPLHERELLIKPFRLMRKEKDGGLIWNKKNHKVYKVDEEAYHAILDLDAGVSLRTIAKKQNVKVQDVARLSKQLLREFK